MPKKILYVVPTLYLDGPGQVLLGIVRHLDRRRFRAFVCGILFKKDPGPWQDGAGPCREAGAEVVDLHLPKPWDVFCLPALLRVIRSARPDVVHTHLTRGHLYGRTAAALAGVPRVVSTVHSVETWMRSRRLPLRAARVAEAATQRFADCIVSVSPSVQQRLISLQGRRARRYEVVLNGVDPLPASAAGDGGLRAEAPWADGTVIVAYAGRLVARKNLHFLVEAFAGACRRSATPVGLVLFGDGPQRAGLVELAQRQGLAGRFYFAGHRREVRRLLRGADVFAMSSDWEGLPMAALEAMEAGLPCVVTNSPGLRESVVHGRTGLIVPAGDVEAMAEALRRLAEDAALRARMGAAGRRLMMQRFTAARMSQEYQRLYLS